MLGRHLTGLALVVWVAGGGGTASAQPRSLADDTEATTDAEVTSTETSQADLDRARERFQEGLSLVEAQQWEQAAERFQEVLAIKSSAVTSYNLASALVHLGRLVEACDLLRPIAYDEAVDPEVRRSAGQLLNETEPRLGTVIVYARGDVAGATLRLGDRELDIGSLGRPVAADPGTMRVSIERDGRTLASEEIDVADDGVGNVEVTLKVVEVTPAAAALSADLAAPDEQDAARTEPPDEGLTGQWWFWTVGAAVVVVATVLTVALASGGEDAPDPVRGDIGDGVVEARVMAVRP